MDPKMVGLLLQGLQEMDPQLVETASWIGVGAVLLQVIIQYLCLYLYLHRICIHIYIYICIYIPSLRLASSLRMSLKVTIYLRSRHNKQDVAGACLVGMFDVGCGRTAREWRNDF